PIRVIATRPVRSFPARPIRRLTTRPIRVVRARPIRRLHTRPIRGVSPRPVRVAGPAVPPRSTVGAWAGAAPPFTVTPLALAPFTAGPRAALVCAGPPVVAAREVAAGAVPA